MAVSDIVFWEVSEILVTGISAALAVSLGGEVTRACVVPGEIAWDDCHCGALYVSNPRWFLSDLFPEGAFSTETQTTPCDLAWLVGEIVIQVMRCAPVPQGNAIAVGCPALSNAAKILVSDSMVMLRTAVQTLCGLVDDNMIVDFAVGDHSSSGPSGACVGSELRVYVSVPRG